MPSTAADLPDVSNGFGKDVGRHADSIGYFAWGCFRYFDGTVTKATGESGVDDCPLFRRPMVDAQGIEPWTSPV